MKLDEFPQAVKEALGYFEAFRRLGFPADDIFFTVYRSGTAQVQLHSQGLQFACGVGLLPARYKTQAASTKLWAEACEVWNAADNKDICESVWNFSHAKREVVGMLAAMTDKGFKWNRVKEGALLN